MVKDIKKFRGWLVVACFKEERQSNQYLTEFATDASFNLMLFQIPTISTNDF